MRNPMVLVQIQKAEDIMVSSGIRDLCVACIARPNGGCCQGCANLGPNGCMEKPLSCALWVCHRVDAVFPDAARSLRELKSGFSYAIASGFRTDSLDYETGRRPIPKVFADILYYAKRLP